MRQIFVRALLYWHTLQHLRLSQIIRRLQFNLLKPKVDLSPPPPLRNQSGTWHYPARRGASLVGPRKFQFLNEVGSIEIDGWDSTTRSKLWRYNQHYFDDLNAFGAYKRHDWHQDLIDCWITRNPPAHGSGWEPYPTSLRVVNWIKAAMSGFVLSTVARESLIVQVRWLCRRLEWHLLGNHIFANAKALIFAGCYFDGPEASSIFFKGSEILLNELKEQILSDGGQYELSPMYHALAIEDVLDLINILRAFPDPKSNGLRLALEGKVKPMMAWLDDMSHPDDQISFFNDAAFGVAPNNPEIRSYAKRLGFCFKKTKCDIRHYQASGYVRLNVGSAALITDVAEVGPSYQPGHAHADTLSFEFSLFNNRLFVNSGTSVYGNDIERLRQRSTEAHSTVMVLEKNSSEVWGGFRVARRARVNLLEFDHSRAAYTILASHDGYARLGKNLDHIRSWKLSKTNLVITDEVVATTTAKAIFHIHPDVIVVQDGDNRGQLILSCGRSISWISQSKVYVSKGTWHPEFGMCIQNQRLVIPLVKGKSKLEVSW